MAKNRIHPNSHGVFGEHKSVRTTRIQNSKARRVRVYVCCCEMKKKKAQHCERGVHVSISL